MAKRSDTKETVLLALELMRRIPKSGAITARELHEHLADTLFARDLRTIQRQLEMLIAHFDIECDDRTKPYGYRWKKFAQGMGLPMLTEQDSLLRQAYQTHVPYSQRSGLSSAGIEVVGRPASARVRVKFWMF